MEYRELSIIMSVKKVYTKPYIQKIKSILWNKFDATCEVEDNSFDGDDYSDVRIYFIATDDQAAKLKEVINKSFRQGLGIHCNF